LSLPGKIEPSWNRRIISGGLQMEEIAHLLLYKLCQKGLTTVEIPRLVKDVLNIVDDSGDNTSATINQKLKTLGWGEAIVDQFTLELIISFPFLNNKWNPVYTDEGMIISQG
jgi:hypothetical protein